MNSETGFSPKLRRLTALLHVCVMIRGELAIGRGTSRHSLVFGRSVWILTMMQSCASAAKLRAAGPFSRSASVPCSNTASRHLGSSTRQSAEKPARAPSRYPGALACWTQDDALQGLASRDKAPERDHQLEIGRAHV